LRVIEHVVSKASIHAVTKLEWEHLLRVWITTQSNEQQGNHG
jgi:hypothetical protein